MHSRYILFIIFFLFKQIGAAQSVWPGDVNNNGIVNKVDLLYLGFAFGETGFARITSDGSWNANDLPMNWDGSFPNGLNYLYADCNGDGIVDELDATIIIENLDLKHDDISFVPDEVLLGEEGINPICKFINTPTSALVDQRFTFDISLGDTNIPIENMSGFTFFLNVEPAFLRLNTIELVFNEDAWIDNTAEQSILIQQKDEDNVRLKVAYTKKDRIPVSGSGSIATVSFVIETDVIDLLTSDTAIFTLDSIIVLNDELEPIPIVTEPLKIFIDRDLKVSTKEHSRLSTIEAYPNPTKGLLLLESSEKILEEIEIINSLGQKVYSQKLRSEQFQSVNIQELNSGFYWLKIYTKNGVKTKSIQKI